MANRKPTRQERQKFHKLANERNEKDFQALFFDTEVYWGGVLERLEGAKRRWVFRVIGTWLENQGIKDVEIEEIKLH